MPYTLPRNITKIQLKDELRQELVTRELFEERLNKIEFKLNILIVIMLILLTFANPAFVALIEKLLNIK